MQDEPVSVALSDGTEEVFAPGRNGVPNQVPADTEDPYSVSIRVVRYAIDPSGALLVGHGVRDADPYAPLPVTTLGEFSVNRLHIVKAFAAGTWTSVSGGDFWQGRAH